MVVVLTLSDNNTNNGNHQQTKTPVERYTADDRIGLAVIFLLLAFGWYAWLAADGDADWFIAATAVLVIVSLGWVYRLITRQAWRIVFSRRADGKCLAAIRIAWIWRSASKQLFKSVYDRPNKIYWRLGLSSISLDDDAALVLTLRMPQERIEETALTKPVEDRSMADTLKVHDVEYIGRSGKYVRYRVIVTDATADVRSATA